MSTPRTMLLLSLGPSAGVWALSGEPSRTAAARSRCRPRLTWRPRRGAASSATLSRTRSGTIPLSRERVRPVLPGAHQPPGEPGLLGAADIRPEIVAHHRPRSGITQPRRRRAKKRRTRLADENRVAPHGVLNPRDERTGIEHEPGGALEVAVPGQCHQFRAAQEVFERLLHEGVGPPLAQIAQEHRVGPGGA